jgi:hypothetical protein
LHRKQFPVALAFALTIHKSQGLTLDRAVLDISMKENTWIDVCWCFACEKAYRLAVWERIQQGLFQPIR